MAKLKEIQHWGALTPKEVARGIEVALQNAQELFEEAQLLFVHKHYARASSLAILSIEETGKVFLLPLLLTTSNGKHHRMIWKGLRDHKQKNSHVSMQMTKGQKKPITKHSMPCRQSIDTWSNQLEDAKQVGFYTDCTSTKDWGLPSEAVGEELAQLMMRMASNSLTKYQGLKKLQSLQYLELWARMMKGMMDMSSTQTEQALVRFYDEGEKNGVLESGTRKEMDEFLKGPQNP